VRFKTISFDDQPDAAQAFLGLHDNLAHQFPLVHRTLKLERVGQFRLPLYVAGLRSFAQAIMLMVTRTSCRSRRAPEGLAARPFGGEIADGFVWGRGSGRQKQPSGGAGALEGSLQACRAEATVILATETKFPPLETDVTTLWP